MSVRPGRTLELRDELIPRGQLIKAIEREMGRTIMHEHRYYLEKQPVHCGDMLELYKDGRWVYGRFEWTGSPEALPTFDFADGIVRLDGVSLLRWPKSGSE